MSDTDDTEAYLRGYEDAMHAAGRGDARLTGETARATPTGEPSFGQRIRYGLGFAFGWLILFPVSVGIVGGVVGFFLGDFVTGALLMGGIAFAFALFVGAGVLGVTLLLRFLPLVILIIVVVVTLRKLLG